MTTASTNHPFLQKAFGAVCKLPGARPLARQAAQALIQHGPISPVNKQRIFNFVSPETANVRLKTRVRVPNSGSVCVSLSLDEVLDRIWYFWGYGWYERELPGFFQRLARDRRYLTVVEVGANVGYFTLLMADAVTRNGDKAHVHAFEPFPPVFEQLKTNVSLNPHLPITVHHKAVADSDGTVSLFLPSDDSAKMFASLVEGIYEQKGSIGTGATRLDTFAASGAAGRIDFIKMDCEGAEPAVVRGAQRLLSDVRPDVLCEVLPATADELNRQFTELGYLKYHVTDSGPVAVDRLTPDAHHRDYLLTAFPLFETSLAERTG